MFLTPRFRDLTYSIPWNCMLIATGCVLFAFGLKTIALPHGFITGGLTGVSILLYYMFGGLTPALWYFLVNAPVFLLGWMGVSRRFVFYSFFGTVVLTLVMGLFNFELPIHDRFLAALAGGTVMGAGCGLALRSIGSMGGLDIVAVLLNLKFNLRIGQVFFSFNCLLFLVSLLFLELELVLYSLTMVFIMGLVTDYFLSMFNQRKMVLIITEKVDDISSEIQKQIRAGVTLLQSRGGYTGTQKEIIMTVINNYQVKRVEELVYSIDSQALTIFGNTWNVLGARFSSRKVY